MTPRGGAAALVLDQHLTALRPALDQRGIVTWTVEDFRAASIVDPEVIRAIARGLDPPWVLITMDGSIVDDFPGFEWASYAIAWIVIPPQLRGIAVEQAKANVLQRHAHQMVEQRRGDHYSYTQKQCFRHPPSLLSTWRR